MRVSSDLPPPDSRIYEVHDDCGAGHRSDTLGAGWSCCSYGTVGTPLGTQHLGPVRNNYQLIN